MLSALWIYNTYYAGLLDKILEGLKTVGTPDNMYGAVEIPLFSLKNLLPNISNDIGFAIDIKMHVTNADPSGANIILEGLSIGQSYDSHPRTYLTVATENKKASLFDYGTLVIPPAYIIQEKFTGLSLQKMLTETLSKNRAKIIRTFAKADYANEPGSFSYAIRDMRRNLKSIYNELVNDGYSSMTHMSLIYTQEFDYFIRKIRLSIDMLNISDSTKETLRQTLSGWIEMAEKPYKGLRSIDPNFYRRVYEQLLKYQDSPALKFLFYIGLEVCVEASGFANRNKTGEMIQMLKDNLATDELMKGFVN
jgi:hypothetical protein